MNKDYQYSAQFRSLYQFTAAAGGRTERTRGRRVTAGLGSGRAPLINSAEQRSLNGSRGRRGSSAQNDSNRASLPSDTESRSNDCPSRIPDDLLYCPDPPTGSLIPRTSDVSVLKLYLWTSTFDVATRHSSPWSVSHYNNNNNNCWSVGRRQRNQLFISATLRSDSAVYNHTMPSYCMTVCEGGGGVRFIPAWFLYFIVLHSVIFFIPWELSIGVKNNKWWRWWWWYMGRIYDGQSHFGSSRGSFDKRTLNARWVTVSALLALLALLINCFYHLLHLNVMCFEQINKFWFDLMAANLHSSSQHCSCVADRCRDMVPRL